MNQLARKIDLIGGEPDLERDIVAPRSSTVRDGIVPMTICLIVALTPLVFAARLFEPYIAAKEILVQAGTATAGLLWLLTARANIRTLTPTAIWVPIVVLVLISAMSLLWSSNPSVSNASFTTYAHNDYLQLWAETGIFGIIAFGAIVFIVLKRGRNLSTDPVALGCWAAVISLLVNAAVAFPLHLPATLMLFVVLIAVVEAAASKKNVGLSNSPIAARVVIVLVTLILCFSAYRSGYNWFVSESVLTSDHHDSTRVRPTKD